MIARFLTYELTIRAPLLLAEEGGDPNSVRSLTWIPGSTMRGVAARRLGPTAADFEALILSGDVRFLPAYPCHPEAGAERSLPVPLSWQRPRSDEERFFDFGAAPSVLDRELPESDRLKEQWQRPDFPFVLLRARPAPVRPSVETRFHHQRDRRVGRATESVGAIFFYEAIEPGTRFRGMVQVSGVDDAECDERARRIKEALGGTNGAVQIGRSRSTEYGGSATIRFENDWQARQIEGAGVLPLRGGKKIDAESLVRVCLLSPAVVRDPLTGQIDPAALSYVIVAAFENRVEVVRQFTASTVVGSFNHKWKTEVPQAMAVAAGSMLVLKAREDLPHGDLLVLEHKGIGERRADGYGTIAWLSMPTSAVVPLQELASASRPPRPSEACSGPILDGLQRRLFEAVVERAVECHAVELVREVNGTLSSMRSLLGRLRVPLRNPDTWEQTFREWLGVSGDGQNRLRRDATTKLEACRLSGGSKQYLDLWLKDIVPLRTSAEWQKLGKGLAEKLFPGDTLDRWWLDDSLPGSAKRQRAEELALEARPALIDRVLALLIKRSARVQNESTIRQDPRESRE